MECLTSENWLGQLKADDKVLLINPPVQEVRYAWVRWNQPTNLLLLSSRLKEQVGCEVELLDFMLPSDSGRVPLRDLARQKPIGQGAFKMTYKSRTYGMPLEEAKRNLEAVLPDWKPTHIVITTLTSYWFETMLTLVPYLRTLIKSAKISLIGAYPILETAHAKRSNVDYVVTDGFSFSDEIPDFGLYYQNRTRQIHNDRVISFGGLKYTKNNAAQNLIRQVEILRQKNIRDYVIFEGNLFQDDCMVMKGFLSILDKENIKINLHGLCGLEIRDAADGIYLDMRKNGYRSFFLEYDLDGTELNLDNYGRAYRELRDPSYARIASGSLAGFLWIGHPQDDLERIFKHSFSLLEICGSIIPKPYTPDPSNEVEYQAAKDRLKRLDLLSPHVFPMAELTGITREEYQDLYKHTTFLNEKRMGNSFDFFDDQYSTIALKRSLGKKGGVRQ